MLLHLSIHVHARLIALGRFLQHRVDGVEVLVVDVEKENAQIVAQLRICLLIGDVSADEIVR